MIENYIHSFNEFEAEFDQLKNSIANPIIQAQELVRFLENKLKYLNKWLKKYRFETQEQEIYFFKVLKPSLVSKIMFYTFLLKTESQLPLNKKSRIKYYQKKLSRIDDFIFENNTFYAYYRSNASDCDYEYFIRKEHTNIHQKDLVLLNSDPKISTSHDFLMAQMIASDLITEWLENLIYKSKDKTAADTASVFTWDGNQYELVELSMGIFHTGLIKCRNMSHYDFTISLGKFLGMELTRKQVTDAFRNIKNRKSDHTKFVEFMNDTLYNKITGESFN